MILAKTVEKKKTIIVANDLIENIYNESYAIRRIDRTFASLENEEKQHLQENFAVIASNHDHFYLVTNDRNVRKLAIVIGTELPIDLVADYLEYFIDEQFNREWDREKSRRIAFKILQNTDLYTNNYSKLLFIEQDNFKDEKNIYSFLKLNELQNHRILLMNQRFHNIKKALKKEKKQHFLSINVKMSDSTPNQLFELGIVYYTRKSMKKTDENYIMRQYVICDNEPIEDPNWKPRQFFLYNFHYGSYRKESLENVLLKLHFYLSEAVRDPDNFHIVVFGSHVHLRLLRELIVPKHLKPIHQRIATILDFESGSSQSLKKSNIFDVMKLYREYNRQNKFISLQTLFDQHCKLSPQLFSVNGYEYEDDEDSRITIGNAGNDAVVTFQLFKKLAGLD